jgi:hypothetical protein
MAGREDKYTTKALMGEGKLSMPSLPSFKDISPAQRKMESREAQDARDSASEKTLRKYNKDLPDMGGIRRTGEDGITRASPRRLGTLDEYVGDKELEGKKRGGSIKKYASGGSIRGGGCEQRGKTKGRMV